MTTIADLTSLEVPAAARWWARGPARPRGPPNAGWLDHYLWRDRDPIFHRGDPGGDVRANPFPSRPLSIARTCGKGTSDVTTALHALPASSSRVTVGILLRATRPGMNWRIDMVDGGWLPMLPLAPACSVGLRAATSGAARAAVLILLRGPQGLLPLRLAVPTGLDAGDPAGTADQV